MVLNRKILRRMILKEVRDLQENENAKKIMDMFADAGDSGVDESFFEQMAAAYNKDGVLGLFGFLIANGVLDMATSVAIFKNYNARKYDNADSVEELLKMVEQDIGDINDKIRKSAQEYKVKRKKGEI